MLNGITLNVCLKAFLGLLSPTDKLELLSCLSHPPPDCAHVTCWFVDHDCFSWSDPAAVGGFKC